VYLLETLLTEHYRGSAHLSQSITNYFHCV